MMFAASRCARLLGALDLQDGLRSTSLGGGVRDGVQTQLTGVGWFKHFFENFLGKPGQILNATSEQGQAVSAANTVIPFHFPPTHWPTSSSYSQPSRRSCSWAASSAASSSVPGACWCRCGRPSCTRLTPSCFWGGGVTSHRRAPSTSPVDRHPHVRWSVGIRCSLVSWTSAGTRQTACVAPTTSSWQQSVPASCGLVGTASTVVTRTTRVPTLRQRWSTPTSHCLRCARLDRDGRLVLQGQEANLLGGVNGMICGLVGITPCAAGSTDGAPSPSVRSAPHSSGSLGTTSPRSVRSARSTTPSVSSTPTAWPASSVDFWLASSADPNMIEYGCGTLDTAGQVVNTSAAAYATTSKGCTPFSVTSLMYNGSFHQLWEQFAPLFGSLSGQRS